MNVEYINPFVVSAVEVFSTMLKCQLSRGELSLNNNFHPEHEVSGVIGLSGNVFGTVIVSLDRQVALAATGALCGETPDTIDSLVIDAVGELTNMIAGRAKSMLAQLDMKLALPTVITGKNHMISFGSSAQTICIPYTCEWGELSIEVGLMENSAGEAEQPALLSNVSS